MRKVAIVLGTSSGIGQAVAGSLLRRGFLVFGGSRGESPIDHENFIDIEIDLTQKAHVENFFNEVRKDTEVVDVLFNAAGMCEMNSVDETSELDLRMHLETNVIAYFHFLKKFESFILSEETHIFNIFSTSAKAFYENTLAYTTGEFAKKGMLGVLEKEWKKYDIRFTNFYIGAVDTPLWDEYEGTPKHKMLTTADFVYMFDVALDAPRTIQFPDLTFMHRDSFLD